MQIISLMTFFQSLTVVIDSSLLNHTFGSELLAALKSAGVRYNIREQKLPSTITWISEVFCQNLSFLKIYLLPCTWENT